MIDNGSTETYTCIECGEDKPRNYFGVTRGLKPSTRRCSECLASEGKTCTRCGIWKSLEEFSINRRHRTGRKSACKSCVHDAYDPRRQQEANLMRLYGVTLEWYEAKLKEQGGLCATCFNVCPSGRNLAVDHNHRTGQPRGLLCTDCNRGIGLFKDSPEALRRAASYLERYS